MTLYDVSFTTKKMIKRLNDKGEVIGETKLDNPITMTALPYATAMSYAIADNFQISTHVPSEKRKFASKGEARPASVGNGTKGRSRRYDSDTPAAAPTTARKTIAEAAATGDLAAALN